MNRNIKIGLVTVGIGAIGFYFWRKNLVPKTSSHDNFVAGLQIGTGDLSTWYPMLPIHEKYDPSRTMGVYKSVQVSTKYKDGMVPARSTDYYNPAQLYASKGDPSDPGGKAGVAMKAEGLVG